MHISPRLLATTFLLSPALSAPAFAQTAEVLHYLVSPSEAAALAVFADAYVARGGEWVDNGVAGADTERAIAMSRIAGGNPPTAMLWEVDTDVQELAAQGLVAPVSAAAPEWAEVLPPSLLEAISHDGELVTVPVAIEARNWLYSSKTITDELGLAEPTTWDEFFANLDAVKDAGYIPLALGGQAWQEWILYSSVLLGHGGSDLFRAIVEDKDPEAALSAEMIGVFDAFRRLNDYVDPGSPGRDWNVATGLVINSEAAYIIMGDWAKGEFTAYGQVAGEDYGCQLSPGTENAYDINVGTFLFPSGGDEAARLLLAEVLMDPEAQLGYAAAKGSLPARLDADVSQLDICAQIGQAVLADADSYVPDLLKNPGGDLAGQIEDVITSFWNDPSMTSEDAARQLSDVLAGAQ